MKKLNLFLLLITLIALTFTGCRFGVKVAYNRADWLIMRQLSDFACLTKGQKNKIESEISGFMTWHRKEELPVYAGYLRELTNAFEKGSLTKEDFERAHSIFEDVQKRTGEKVKDVGIDFVMSLSSDQVECSFANFEKRNEEKLKELALSETEFRKKRKEELIKQTKNILGSVTQQQIALADTIIPPLSEEKEIFAATSRKREHTKKVLLMPNSPQKRAEIIKLIEEPHALYTDREKQLVEKRRKETKEAMWKLNNTLTPKQRQSIVKQLNNYAKAFEDLSKE
jgi:hypothetical protein